MHAKIRTYLAHLYFAVRPAIAWLYATLQSLATVRTDILGRALGLIPFTVTVRRRITGRRAVRHAFDVQLHRGEGADARVLSYVWRVSHDQSVEELARLWALYNPRRTEPPAELRVTGSLSRREPGFLQVPIAFSIVIDLAGQTVQLSHAKVYIAGGDSEPSRCICSHDPSTLNLSSVAIEDLLGPLLPQSPCATLLLRDVGQQRPESAARRRAATP